MFISQIRTFEHSYSMYIAYLNITSVFFIYKLILLIFACTSALVTCWIKATYLLTYLLTYVFIRY